jgi:hypothetical protein
LQGRSRAEVVVVVSSGYSQLTPRFLQSLFDLDIQLLGKDTGETEKGLGNGKDPNSSEPPAEQPQLQSYLLAIADGDGSVSFMRMHRGLQPPLGNPAKHGQAEDEEGMVQEGADSDAEA